MLLHNAQELNNDLGAWADEDLTLSGFLGVVDGVEGIVQDACFDHSCGVGVTLGRVAGETGGRER